MQMHYQVAAEKAAILREETLEEDGKAEIMNNLTLTGAAIEDLCMIMKYSPSYSPLFWRVNIEYIKNLYHSSDIVELCIDWDRLGKL